jgi:hypothetical protein
MFLEPFPCGPGQPDPSRNNNPEWRQEKKPMLPLPLLLVTLARLGLSHATDRASTQKRSRVEYRSLMGLMPSLLGMVGLVLALLPPHLLGDLFKTHGLAEFALISVIGAVVTMPGPVAFPLAGSLMHMGVSLTAMAAIITTLTLVGIVTASMEAAAFGKRFPHSPVPVFPAGHPDQRPEVGDNLQ